MKYFLGIIMKRVKGVCVYVCACVYMCVRSFISFIIPLKSYSPKLC